jgi:hypothetical protein
VTLRTFEHIELIDRRDPAVIAARRQQIAREMQRVAKASEASLPQDLRRQVLIVQSQQIERTYSPTAWEQTKWIAAFLLTGLALGAITIACIDWCMR